MPLVKICGICRLEDAEKAVELGADFLGFIFAESPRKIEAADARMIRRRLGDRVKCVGVFKDQSAQIVNDTADALKLDFVQLHGSESAQFCSQIHHPIIKAVELQPGKTELSALSEYGVHAFLFDRPKALSRDAGWLNSVVEDCAAQIDRWRPFFIAGGLTAENLQLALRLDPYGVDTASGVESQPGVKDEKKLESFFQSLRGSTIC